MSYESMLGGGFASDREGRLMARSWKKSINRQYRASISTRESFASCLLTSLTFFFLRKPALFYLNCLPPSRSLSKLVVRAIWFVSVKLCSGQDDSTASEPDRFVRRERVKEWQGSWLGAYVKGSTVYVSSHTVISYRMRLIVRLSISVGREED